MEGLNIHLINQQSIQIADDVVQSKEQIPLTIETKRNIYIHERLDEKTTKMVICASDGWKC